MRLTKYLVLPLLAVLCGCGKFFVDNPHPPGSTGNAIYIANMQASSVAGFSVSTTTGALTALSGGNTSVAAGPTALVPTPTGTFLYVGSGSGGIFVYSIAANGTLTVGNGGTAVATSFTSLSSMAIDSTGTWLLAVDRASQQISEFKINATTGVLTLANPPSVPLDQPASPSQIYITPNNQFVYVALQTGGVDAFTFNSSTGVLANRRLSPTKAGTAGPNSDLAVLADPNTKFLFVGETGTNGGIRVFNIGANGVLTEVSGSPFTSGLGPSAFAMDSTGAFLYVANRGASNISGYSLTVNGSLVPLASSPFTAGTLGANTGPQTMTLDQTGKYLAVVSAGGGPDLQVFSFDATTAGKLNSVATSQTGTDPVGAIAVVSVK